MKYKAFAEMQDANGKKWRVNIYDYDTKEEAIEAAKKFYEKYMDCWNKAIYVGIEILN